MTPVKDVRTDGRPRGQILVIFALAIMVMMGMVALVIDVSWYWTNALRVQRAADAAALAGVVWLPGQSGTAYTTAKLESRKNGYTDGVNGVTIATAQEPATTGRRLAVTVNASIGTYFMRLIGINSIPVSRTARAEYVLPVPMGSPQNYYGVGSLDGLQTVTVTNPPTYTNNNSGFLTPAAAGAAAWAGTGNLRTNNDVYASSTTNNQQQQWINFGLAPALAANQTMAGPIGIEVRLSDASISAACANSSIRVELSWDGGATWSSPQTTAALTTSITTGDFTFGSAANTTVWGGHTWVYNDFTDTWFRARLTALKGCATVGTQLRLDMLEIRATYRIATTTTTTTTSPITRPVNDPVSGTALTSQGFWGAVITKGGDRSNGDRYSPANNGGPANPEYSALGYDYTIEVAAGGSVALFDPTFCATGPNTSGGSYGTGDHWIGTAGRPVTTVFTLFNTNGTLVDTGDDTQLVTSAAMFANQIQADYSGDYGSPGGSYTNCAADIYHNNWWTMRTGLAAGTYRLNVNTSSAGNNTTNAENMWSIEVSGGAAPRVYGSGRMAAYNNLQAGTQRFYLAQIDAVHAGKTMVIDLFDPGDISGNGFLRVLSPDGNAYNYSNFTYTADNGRSGSGNVIQTAAGGTSYFQNSVLTIEIPLPSSYGRTGLTPPGEAQAGWWKIEYQVGGGNDTTTWSVTIRGNPVHLVIP